MIKYYIILYLDLFIKGLIFLLFGMKTWSIYTCNKDYFEKKYNHVKNFGDIYNIQKWEEIEKLSVCDDDTNIEGLGFIKNGFVYSINWTDYWTKRWICFFLNFGLESFCCDDPKQNCLGDTEFLMKELPDAIPKHTDTIFLGVLSFIKIIAYGGLNLLYLFILFPICTTGGFTGSMENKDHFRDLLDSTFKEIMLSFPKMPTLLEIISWPIRILFIWLPAYFGIFCAKWAFFFVCWGMLTAFNYVRILFFMLSGEECGCNLFTKWEKQTNKLILIRMAIPILIWASLMFSLFIFYQISMMRGITSPEIMPPYMFKEVLQFYFMKHDINTLKGTNMKSDKIDEFYKHTYTLEENVERLTKNDFMDNTDESYHLNRLPHILAALQISLEKKDNLQTLNDAFKYNQMVLSNALNHIYGEGLEVIYDKLYKYRHINGEKNEEIFAWWSIVLSNSQQEEEAEVAEEEEAGTQSQGEEKAEEAGTQSQAEVAEGDELPGSSENNDKKKYTTPEIIEKYYEYKVIEKNLINRPEDENLKNNKEQIIDEINNLIDQNNQDYYDKMSFFMKENGTPDYTEIKTEKNNGSIGQLIQKIYEFIALFANMPFKFLNKILTSGLMDIPNRMIDTLLSEKVLGALFLIPEKLIELPIFFLELPMLAINFFR